MGRKVDDPGTGGGGGGGAPKPVSKNNRFVQYVEEHPYIVLAIAGAACLIVLALNW